MLFMQTGNIDVWDAIQKRVIEMNREDMYAEKAQKEAAARKQKEFEDMLLMIAVVFGAMVFIGGLLFVATQMAQ
jgi:hypothetical protein